MKASVIALIAASLAAISPACLGRTHTIRSQQELPDPGAAYQSFGLQVSIDGDSIIALADREGGRSALLYRRGANGRWSLSRVLLDVTATPENLRADLAMKNGIAVIGLDGTTHAYELTAGQWVEAVLPAEASQARGSVAISKRRIALGVQLCRDDTLLLTESAADVWTVTGRATGDGPSCGSVGVARELNNNTLFVRNLTNEVHIYARSNTEEWPRIGGFTIPGDVSNGSGPVALQNLVAVAPGSTVFRGEASAWGPAGVLMPIDYANGSGFAFQVVFRDGVAISKEGWGDIHAPWKPYVYVDKGSSFDHVAILETAGFTDDFDVSGRTVVASSDDIGTRYVQVFTLPSPLNAPRAVADDFEHHTSFDWEQPSAGKFVMTQLGSNTVYRNFNTSNEAHAVVLNSDWPEFQSIEADIKPTSVNGADRWTGLGLRYVDENNFYYLTWRSSNVLQIKRKVNGVIATLAETTLPMTFGQQRTLRFSVDRNFLTAWVNGAQVLGVTDYTFKRGRAALMAYRVGADYDNVYAGPTAPLNLAWKNYREVWYDWGRDFDFTRGNWMLTGDVDPDGLSQTDTSTSAYALVGSDTDEQRVASLLRLDTFNGTASQPAWFGLFARYADASNYYQLSLRSTNQLQIRKVVGGQLTVLAAAAFTAVPGRFYELRLDVFGDELHAYVDGVLVAKALDGALTHGHYGIGTYRTAATFQTFIVHQP